MKGLRSRKAATGTESFWVVEKGDGGVVWGSGLDLAGLLMGKGWEIEKGE